MDMITDNVCLSGGVLQCICDFWTCGTRIAQSKNVL